MLRSAVLQMENLGNQLTSRHNINIDDYIHLSLATPPKHLPSCLSRGLHIDEDILVSSIFA